MTLQSNRQVYRINRVIGNNFVCANDPDGREIILRGLGIGYKKRPGDLVPQQKIEKIYALRDPEKNNRLVELLSDVPPEFLAVSSEIIETAEHTLGRRLSENVYITLTDHICFAVERLRGGVEYPNHLLWEINHFYPNESALGKQAVDIIEQRLGYRLPADEAGFIALHLVNAEIDGRMSDMVRITEVIRKIIEIVQDYYNTTLDETSLDFGRFITHLKFLGQRILRHQYTAENDDEFHLMMVRRYPHDYQCAEQVRAHLQAAFDIKLPAEELAFLTIHLHRLALSMGLTKQEE